MCLRDQLKSFGVIWDHLESFKSSGNNISYTIDTVILRFWAGLNLSFVKDIHVVAKKITRSGLKTAIYYSQILGNTL